MNIRLNATHLGNMRIEGENQMETSDTDLNDLDDMIRCHKGEVKIHQPHRHVLPLSNDPAIGLLLLPPQETTGPGHQLTLHVIAILLSETQLDRGLFMTLIMMQP